MATIAEIKRMFPNKPIKYVVNTHHHSDHSGGIRAYVAEGIPIITHKSHRRYYEQEIFKNPHTLNPDRLARMPRSAMIETIDEKRVLTDADMTLELYLVRGNLHSEGHRSSSVYDTIIQHGTIIDGTKAPRRRAGWTQTYRKR